MIYIVDDDRATRDSLRLLLECAGLEAVEFPSVREFLEARQAHGQDCLVLDIHMPGMGGIELLAKMRERGDHIPVIIITDHAASLDTGRARSAGAVALLEKPYKPDEIVGLVRHAIGREPSSGGISTHKRPPN